MAQAICTACSFKIDLPPQVQLSKVTCPRCRGALAPASALAAAPPQAAAVQPRPETPRSASPTPARPQPREPLPAKTRPVSRTRPDAPSQWAGDIDDEPAGMNLGLKITLITVPIIAVVGAILFIALNRGASTPDKPDPNKIAKGGGDPFVRPDPIPGGGPGPGFDPAKNPQLQFLGAIGQGRRFVIVADRSGSMSAPVHLGKPDEKGRLIAPSMECLHEELIRTVKDVPAGAFFYVSFFDDHTIPMPRGDNWVEGGGDLTDIINWIRTVGPRGGTQPLPGFQKAFSLDPPPEVIFFMTDGEFPDATAPIAMMNDRLPKKAVIHSIRFDNSPGFGGGGAGNRQARVMEIFDLPPPVHTQFAIHSGGGLGKGFGGRISSKQLEIIAAASGGTFRDFGGADAKKDFLKKGGPLRAPVLAVAGDLTPTDPICRHRPGSHAKTFDVFLQAGMHYEIDMVGHMDPYLILENAAGAVLASNDDGGGNLNSLIVIRPAVTGPHRIFATTCGPNRTGPFAITVVNGPF